MSESRPMRPRLLGLAVIASVVAAWIAFDRFAGVPPPEATPAAPVVVDDPAQLVVALVNQPKAQATATLAGDTLAVTINLDPYSLTHWTMVLLFEEKTMRIVPAVFDRFPAIERIEITGYAPFQDVRGNRSSEPALKIAFTRANASTVHWPNMNFDDVPKVADSFWEHSSLRD
ncbi:MAG: hypothetical protein ABSC37_20075 [Xanthobacteraceae bacterium]